MKRQDDRGDLPAPHSCEFVVFNSPQLQPWLVPHWVQQPQAPARTTLSEPQFEQMMPM